jgi:phosphatidylglycerophosphatase C
MSLGSDAPRPSVLPLVTAEHIVERLEALLSDGAGRATETLLAFDADGTLWSGDVGIDNFEALLDRGAVLPAALSMLRDEATSAGLPLAEDATAQARILYQAYERGAYSEERAFRTMACGFAGYRKEEVRAFAAGVAGATRLRARLHAEVLPILAWASRRGVLRYIVSASHAVVVASSIEQMGLSIDGIFAMSQAEEEGVLLARLIEPATYGAGKTAALYAGIGDKTLLGAFGDSAFDLHLLREARLAVAVRPKPELRARAAECSGLVELAPAPG